MHRLVNVPMLLIAGGIDISFTATASVAQYVALTLAIRYGLGWFAMFAIAGEIGIACGATNALFITRLRISSRPPQPTLSSRTANFAWPEPIGRSASSILPAASH